MRFPMLKPMEKRRVFIDRFRGYSHTPEPEAGAFYDMENLSGQAAPHLCVRGRRIVPAKLDGAPAQRVNALGGRGDPVLLDQNGTLWCGGFPLPRLLEGTDSLRADDENGQSVDIPDRDKLLRVLPCPGDWSFRYVAASQRWRALHSGTIHPGDLFSPAQPTDGMTVSVSWSRSLLEQKARKLVFLGAWVCVFPDGKFANTAKLHEGSPMLAGEDYGDIAQENICSLGGTLFTACDAEGTALEVLWSDTAPAQGCWVDSSEPEKHLRRWSQSQGLWTELTPYVKCAIPGIAKGLRSGDSVELFCRLSSGQEGERLIDLLWDGTKTLTAAFHDPGDGDREEGRNDYVIFPGLLPQTVELELSWHNQDFFRASRSIPEMDFVVEAGNRLWGCRSGGGVNELYGSKLGDFRNWSAFEGLSTDSYRVARGRSGPFTGAAVLGDCPLFFRADCLEKIYPSPAGDHGVVTVSLEGIQAGSAESAVVMGSRLYYKSEGGICCYNGTLPVRVSQALGDKRYHSAAAGARGSLYCVSMLDETAHGHFFVYDTVTGLWHREDDLRFRSAWGMGEQLWLLTAPGEPLLLSNGSRDCAGVRWWAETGELLPRLARRRYLSQMQVTARLDPGARLRVLLSMDGGPWLPQGELPGGALGSVSFPVPDRRCQRLRLRLEGTGGMELHSLSWLTEAGSDV